MARATLLPRNSSPLITSPHLIMVSWTHWFCHEDSFHLNETWYSEHPEFSRCFVNSISYVIPLAIYLVAYVPIRVTLLLIRSGRRLDLLPGSTYCPPWNRISLFQLFSLSFLLVISLFQLIFLFSLGNWSWKSDPPVDLLSQSLKCSAIAIAVIFTLWHRRLSMDTSPSLWILSLWFAIASSINFILTLTQPATFDQWEVYSLYLQFPASLLTLFAQSFSTFRPSSYTQFEDSSSHNGQDDTLDPNPQLHASFLSKVTFSWVFGLIWKGWKKDPLALNDLYQMRPKDTSAYIGPLFFRAWAKSRNSRVTLIHDTLNSSSSLPQITPAISDSSLDISGVNDDFEIANDDSGPIIAPIDEESVDTRNQKPGNLFMCLIKCFGWYYLGGVVGGILLDVFVLVNPMILKWLLNFMKSEENTVQWHGYAIILSFFLVSLMQSLSQNFFFNRLMVLGVQIRTAIVTLIYRKALKISNASRNESTTGEIVNLMSVDADRFRDFFTFVDVIWSGPIRIFVSIYFIYRELGYSVFAGVGVILVLIPFTTYISKYLEKVQAKQMAKKDERVKLTNEMLSGIKVIKLYAWEKSFTQLVADIRNLELQFLRGIVFCNAAFSFVFTSTPVLVALATFTTYALSDSSHVLDAEKAFVSLAYFTILKLPLTNAPYMFIQLVMIRVATKRLNKFLNMPELKKYITHNKDKYLIRITGGGFENGKIAPLDEKKKKDEDKKKKETSSANGTGPPPSNGIALSTAANGKAVNEPNEDFELKNINMKIKEGSFVAIVGPVGSGKSTLISAILGELEKKNGSINILPGTSVGYVPQQAWIQNASLKDNILFGQPFRESKYREIVSACQLLPDLAILPAGDLTEIGEKGINLSGGQKQRLSLARACYANAKLYLLDDPLSAVDAHVAKSLYEEVLSSKTGLLRKKTRILVTNDISILPKVDHIYVMVDGTITESGKHAQLMVANGKFAEFVKEFSVGKAEAESAPSSPVPESMSGPGLNRTVSRFSDTERPESRQSGSEATLESNIEARKLIDTEYMETGKVKMKVYLAYVKRISLISVSILCYILMQTTDAGNNYWLAQWANDGNATDIHPPGERLGVYGALALSQVVLVVSGTLILARGAVVCSLKMHNDLLHGVLRSPMSFFDTTPLGRIINRFSKDIDLIDTTLPNSLDFWLIVMVQVIATFAVVAFVTPIFILVIIPVGILYYAIQKFYISTNRQLRRLLSVNRSPVYSHFSETLTGISTIRAFNSAPRFAQQSDDKLDKSQSASYCSVATNRWLSIRLQFIGNCVVISAAMFCIFARDRITASLTGLSITYAMSLTSILNWLVMNTSSLETDIVAVERVLEYSVNKSEAKWESEEAEKPPPQWPREGRVEFVNYSTRYRDNLDPVLKQVSFRVNGAEKVGIVGRTGAGKSSIALALFRIIEPIEGTIVIDDIDVTKIGLHDLREALTIIPQDPVLFSGKLRINLDPFSKHTDEELWRALEMAHLKDFVSQLEGGLDHAISEGGSNLSVGQRQLVCLARALLKKTKILILDEATAAVDLQTDSLIQSTVRSEFAECTILTIAHRINTILDSDRILVLDQGQVAEFAPPKELLEKPESRFYSLAKDAGII